MTSVLEEARTLVTQGSRLGARIEGLEQAVQAGRGRLDDALLDSAAEVADRAVGRMRLSSEHTVVGIAGATGSGKSSTFNALTGLELSAVGVRRPTTSWATACVWGAAGADELLEWLGIPPRHQTTRDSMLDTRREGHELDGVVLLDLPDHDSTEVTHHLEVDRLVVLADVLVWVLDPQKYADAAIHDRYLHPLRTHADVMVVVLNHIDTVPEERREAMLADVRRLLDADGLPGVPVIAASAKGGVGVSELKAEIVARVEAKQMTRTRLEADLRATAARVAEASGSAEAQPLGPERMHVAEDALAESAGVPGVVAAAERSMRIRTLRATGWPPVSLLSRLRGDPLARVELDLGTAGRALAGRSAGDAAPAVTPVARSRVDGELRSMADETSAGMTPPWVDAVARASTARRDELVTRLDATLADTDLGVARLPGWAIAIRVVQVLLLLAAVAGLVWTIVLAVEGSLGDDSTPAIAGVPLALVLLVGGLVLGIALALVCRRPATATARSRAEAADRRLRGAVAELVGELVGRPVQAELAAYAVVRDGLARALAS